MAEQADPSWCFPNKLEDIAVLEAAIAKQPDAAKAYYYLGSLYYDKLQFAKAIELWEKSVSLDDTYPTAHRNLALACYNKQGNPGKALVELEKAFSLDDGDARVFLELDQLYKKLGRSFEERLENYQKHMDILSERDDVMLEYVTLYNLSGQYERAYMTIMGHQFRPWEGAEGRISGQYKTALTELGKKELQEGHYDKAETYFRKALEYPHCLGEGRLEGTKDNDIHYYLGIIHKVTDRAEEAGKEFRLATLGEDEPAGVLYYYDQPADMIFYKGLAHGELGDHAKMCSCFSKLMDYGERHLYEKMKDDFFAVSLPDFMIFEEDMDRKNQAHCHYLMGLACLGLGGKERAAEEFDKAIGLDYNHQKARIYKEMTTLQFSADKA